MSRSPSPKGGGFSGNALPNRTRYRPTVPSEKFERNEREVILSRIDISVENQTAIRKLTNKYRQTFLKQCSRTYCTAGSCWTGYSDHLNTYACRLGPIAFYRENNLPFGVDWNTGSEPWRRSFTEQTSSLLGIRFANTLEFTLNYASLNGSV